MSEDEQIVEWQPFVGGGTVPSHGLVTLGLDGERSEWIYPIFCIRKRIVPDEPPTEETTDA